MNIELNNDAISGTLPPMQPITSLIKALDVLTLLSNKREALSLSELAEAMNLPRSTLQRTLHSLISYGLIEKKDRMYAVSNGFNQWAQQGRQHYWIQLYRKVLESVAERTGELVLLGLQEGNGIVHVDYIESDHMVRVAPAPDTRHPMEVTAAGKLALSRRADLQETLTDPALKEELMEIQKSGVAWNREQSVPGMVAMATSGFTNNPIEPILIVAWPSNRFTEEKGTLARTAVREALDQFAPDSD